MFYEDNSEEVISAWVRRLMEQFRIMKRFPSDLSLASTSSSASGWSGLSGPSSKFASSLSGQAFQHMDTSWERMIHVCTCSLYLCLCSSLCVLYTEFYGSTSNIYIAIPLLIFWIVYWRVNMLWLVTLISSHENLCAILQRLPHSYCTKNL